MSDGSILLLLIATSVVVFPPLFALWMRWIDWVDKHLMPG